MDKKINFKGWNSVEIMCYIFQKCEKNKEKVFDLVNERLKKEKNHG